MARGGARRAAEAAPWEGARRRSTTRWGLRFLGFLSAAAVGDGSKLSALRIWGVFMED